LKVSFKGSINRRNFFGSCCGSEASTRESSTLNFLAVKKYGENNLWSLQNKYIAVSLSGRFQPSSLEAKKFWLYSTDSCNRQDR
jgi:hypothetical protein